MQEGLRIEKYPIVIKFLGTYVIVMGVSNLPHVPMNIEMETFSIICLSLSTQCTQLILAVESMLWQ